MTLKEIENIDFEKGNGIVPVIVQDSNSKEVLTLAYSNKESLELTKKTGNSWFWSRSRNKLWMKGEESGNTQKVKKILVDCDSDAIIYLVEHQVQLVIQENKHVFIMIRNLRILLSVLTILYSYEVYFQGNNLTSIRYLSLKISYLHTLHRILQDYYQISNQIHF